MHVCVLRLPMVYGLAGEGNIARMIAAVARNRFPPWPKIENRRVAVHIDDVIRAALLVVCDPRAAGQVYLVTDGQTYSTRWLYERIRLALGRPPPHWTVPLWALQAAAAAGSLAERVTGRAMPLNRTGLDKLTGNAWFSSRKIARGLGFEPQRDLETEIPRMVRDHVRGKS
jgi:nucleoside-diphosphate-sugar epimerase